MEILELVHQEHAPTEERPFACSVPSCNKTFGKQIILKYNKRRKKKTIIIITTTIIIIIIII